jgi:hypothetical protein
VDVNARVKAFEKREEGGGGTENSEGKENVIAEHAFTSGNAGEPHRQHSNGNNFQYHFLQGYPVGVHQGYSRGTPVPLRG